MNTPTVQEFLQDASREVRSIMWDVSALDGPGLAAAWPAFAARARVPGTVRTGGGHALMPSRTRTSFGPATRWQQ